MRAYSLPFCNLQRSQWQRLADVGALTALVIIVGAVVYSAARWQGGDFRAFYAAARVAAQGGNPYDYRQVSAILWELAGLETGAGIGLYYPP